MEEEESVGCGRPTGSVVGGTLEGTSEEKPSAAKEVTMTMVSVGGKAPDFVAPAYYKGKYVKIKLSDYLGKWVLLCFYPGDFTFV